MKQLCIRDRWLLAIVIVAAVLRIAYLVDVIDSPYYRHPVLDSYLYHMRARDIAQGDLLARSESFRMPLYDYFLGGLYALFRYRIEAALLVQVLLGAVICGLIYKTASNLFGKLAGVSAGLGFALYRMAIYSDAEILPTTLFLFLLLSAVLLILRFMDSGKVRDGFIAGLLLGLAFLTRGEALLYIALIVAGVLLLGGRKALKGTLTMIGAVLILVLLLGLRNYICFGEFYVIPPQGSVNFYVGNASYADGKSPVAPPTRHVYTVTADPEKDTVWLGCKRAASESVGRNLSDREVASYYRRKAIGEIRNDFSRWLKFLGRKIYYFFNSYERSDIKPLAHFINKYSTVLKLPLVSYSMIMPLGIAGLVLTLTGGHPRRFIITLLFAASMASCVAFFVIWRLRLPSVVFLTILSGLALSEIIKAIREARYGFLTLVATVIVISSIVTTTRYYDVSSEDWLSFYLTNEATILRQDGRTSEAIHTYEEAISADPRNAHAYYLLGRTYGSLGETEKAGEYLIKAANINPGYRAFSYFSLGVIHAQHEDFHTAARYFEKALELDPSLCLAAFNLGISLIRSGELEGGRKALLKAATICESDASMLLRIATVLIEIDASSDALRILRGLLNARTQDPEILYAMGLASEKAGKIEQAYVYYKRALEISPGSTKVREKLQKLGHQ